MSYTGINKSVYDKLPKQEVELSKMEVELANVKDIPKKLKSVIDVQKKLDKDMPALEKLQAQVKENKDILKMRTDEAERMLDEISQKAKELGVDPNTFQDFKQLSIEISNSRSEYLK